MMKRTRILLIFLTLSLVAMLTACQGPSQPAPEPSDASTDRAALIRPVTSGGDTYFAIQADGRLLGWGRSDAHALGGSQEAFSYEAPNEMMSSVKYVSGGQWVTFVIDSEGVLWGTGTDYFGHLGEIEDNSFQMVKIMEDVAYASSSQQHSLALKTDNSLWCWGKGRAGIPGEEPQYDNPQLFAPEKIMDDVIYAVAAGNGGYAIKSDNSLWEWGMVSPDPEKIMDDVEYVCDAMAIKQNGDLMTWTYTEDGVRTQPVLTLQDVFCCDQGAAVQNDGSLWVWGDNTFGQLGDGTNEPRTEPYQLMNDAAYVARGNQCTLIVKRDGSLWQAGSADGFSPEYAVPHQIGESIWLPHEGLFQNGES